MSSIVIDNRTANSDRLLYAGLASGIVAAVATASTAALSHGLGTDLMVGGEQVPIGGFVMLTMVGALLGVALAAVAKRFARHPHRLFIRTTVALTALSLIPDFTARAHWDTRFTLAATHLIAAAIIVPVIARRLNASR